ncbi:MULTISPECIES: gephyrin-like molybdotransferase Glp [unclassified Microbacterium]|uniref:molybdopterin molybdotransferase MoeA n=1 Tax=unclassified Microbacterium TaxID=2609290 RepID=UPI0013858C5A|nr:molybdopterin molybdenumtransferase MoeA [Microbacterium sp. MAH-37]
MTALRSVEDQLDRVLAALRPPAVERMPLGQASGRVLTEPALARNAVPPFDNSAMDGFAVRFADAADATPAHPVSLRVVADVPAGSALDPAIGPGEAARIMTGAPVPSEADAIVPFEDTAGGLADSLASAVVLAAPRRRGAHVRAAGEDVAAGAEVLPAGTRLGARQLSALASVGIAQVAVARRPRVMVVATGSELVPPGQPLTRGTIPESNSLLIAGLVADTGAEVVARRVVDDSGDGPAEAVAAARQHACDAVIFSGGVSAGAYEVVRQSLGDAMEFTKVAMQPGKPQGFGATDDGMLLFGLPGNPVSAAVSFEVFVRPALLRMQGCVDVARVVWRLPAGEAWSSAPGRRQYLPAVIDRSDPARPVVRSASSGGSGSHLVVGLGGAEAYAIVPESVTAVEASDLVDVVLL